MSMSTETSIDIEITRIERRVEIDKYVMDRAGCLSWLCVPVTLAVCPCPSCVPDAVLSPQGWLCVLAVLAALGQCRGLRRAGAASAHSAVRCFSGAELGDEAPAQLLGRSLRWDRHLSVQLVPQLERLEAAGARRRRRRQRPPACPALSLRTGLRSEPHERSISPWRYRIDEDENRYPRKLAFAECLCSGCVDVKTGRETTALNSVTIQQTMLVLRRKPCPRPAGLGLVALEVDYIRVPVGCTCVLPRTAH
ncbi:interleukin-17C [Zonotrichia leucophrys gambelii]|uniref:interleukin-17C n=1 Tax=Zonotrichia leucophrys gambelii TaxID=257770 RepID=UPI0031403692